MAHACKAMTHACLAQLAQIFLIKSLQVSTGSGNRTIKSVELRLDAALAATAGVIVSTQPKAMVQPSNADGGHLHHICPIEKSAPRANSDGVLALVLQLEACIGLQRRTSGTQ